MPTQLYCAFHGADPLGEVPLWNAADQTLWWIDVYRPALQGFTPTLGRHQHHVLPGKAVGAWTLRQQGGMVVALDCGLHSFDPATGHSQPLAGLIADHQAATHRPNDGKCDRRGRLWFGTLNHVERTPTGGLFSFSTETGLVPWLDGIATPNGLCFSPDDRILYFCDSRQKAIWAFDFDLDEGRISNRRVFCDLSADPGIPDGSTVDADGFLWNAAFGASRIIRYDPKGRVDRIIDVPTRQPTSLAFGGPGLRTLFITTAALRLSPDELQTQPWAGALLACEPGPAGLPEPAFAG